MFQHRDWNDLVMTQCHNLCSFKASGTIKILGVQYGFFHKKYDKSEYCSCVSIQKNQQGINKDDKGNFEPLGDETECCISCKLMMKEIVRVLCRTLGFPMNPSLNSNSET